MSYSFNATDYFAFPEVNDLIIAFSGRFGLARYKDSKKLTMKDMTKWFQMKNKEEDDQMFLFGQLFLRKYQTKFKYFYQDYPPFNIKYQIETEIYEMPKWNNIHVYIGWPIVILILLCFNYWLYRHKVKINEQEKKVY